MKGFAQISFWGLASAHPVNSRRWWGVAQGVIDDVVGLFEVAHPPVVHGDLRGAQTGQDAVGVDGGLAAFVVEVVVGQQRCAGRMRPPQPSLDPDTGLVKMHHAGPAQAVA